ncbi:MAG: hypothetical protein A2977_02035 [Alphaproteobacteria bacterium RIFCSPLOWO2_01_FULL_45_8]|nr:MAG: hypothetical protein A3K20_02490 [Alphaproteobacteria bacterium GWA1_45_9]OFW89365.1 MAG: hypothetical protein A2621_00300 [Alphaproteobacteria bacterium RIFCSPHIGHO2_01_FULL_41_14]OFW96356.1 MAG: hypothetical protein A2977_02035 [Alphaproteobacteria bacterium RIFCSPLOWO2_01_FULL_45_8]HCI48759.1 hypothetical protein [Holosporales bacterium]
MLKKKFIIVCFIFVGKISFVLSEPAPNLCAALKQPNSLLLGHFTKIKLKKNCTQNSLVLSSPQAPTKKIGCYYEVPTPWAESIDYPQLSKWGLILVSSKNVMCPRLTYSDFENLTLKGRRLIDDIKWRTLQVNKVKRLLKKSQRVPPTDSPDFISPKERLEIDIYHLRGFSIPLIRQKFPLM